MKNHIKFFLLFLIHFSLSGCAAHKIELYDSAYSYRNQNEVKVSVRPERVPHCGAMLLTVVTAGIIPSGCERIFVVTSLESPKKSEIAKVSFMQGWVTLLLTPFSSWSFSQGRESIEEEIENKINGRQP